MLGPVLGMIASAARSQPAEALTVPPNSNDPSAPRWGVDPTLFGKKPDGSSAAPNSLVVQAPAMLTVRAPAELVAGSEFVVTASLDPALGAEGSIQPRVATAAPESLDTLLAGAPIVTCEGSQARARVTASMADLRRLFPPAVAYPHIVPVDEAVTLQLLHRDDEPLCLLMLDDAEHARLDTMWDELRFISQDPLKLQDAFDQLMEYATQDSDPKLFEPYRKPIADGVIAFRERLVACEPKQLDHLINFAALAYRRPLSGEEADELRGLYRKLRSEQLSHDEAFHLVLARVLVAPAFLYRVENAGPGSEPLAISDWEMASRLSYFLWSTGPDAALRARAAAGELHDADILVGEARRMVADDRARSLATEFACHWLDVHDFDKLDEKSEQHFPEFTSLRGDMYEETVRFFADLFQRDGSLIEVLDADHTFLNQKLAEFYGIPGVTAA